MILITGATGKMGNIVIDTLLKKGVPAGNIRALEGYKVMEPIVQQAIKKALQ